MDSQWLNSLFEGGFFELVLLIFLYGLIFKKLVSSIIKGDLISLILLCSFTGLFIISFFGSLFNEPKITWIFYLLIWFVLINPTTENRTLYEKSN